jgi:hypothetical protein
MRISDLDFLTTAYLQSRFEAIEKQLRIRLRNFS